MAAEKPAPITLRSSDLQEFPVSESTAFVSLTIKGMLEDDLPTGSVIPLLNVDGKTLASIITYMVAHSAGGDQEKFDSEFVSEKEIDVLFVEVQAANYLNIPGLFQLLCRNIADRIKNKSVGYLRNLFGQKNDFTAEEEEEMRTQNHWVFGGDDSDGTATAAAKMPRLE